MTRPTRHGLRTLPLPTALTADVLTGRATVVVRPRTTDDDLERPGERVVLVDDGGRSVAVAAVTSAAVASPATVAVHIHVVGLDDPS